MTLSAHRALTSFTRADVVKVAGVLRHGLRRHAGEAPGWNQDDTDADQLGRTMWSRSRLRGYVSKISVVLRDHSGQGTAGLRLHAFHRRRGVAQRPARRLLLAEDARAARSTSPS